MERSGEKQAYQDRLKAHIEEWESRIEQLAARAIRAEAALRERLSSEESGLLQQLAEARSRLRELIDASEEGWEEVKAGAEKIWVDVREAWERAGRVREKEPSEATDLTS
jgi:hypothetical protein